MKLTENTIFITGGGSGIGRGLAEALHKLGNKVIISGRRKGYLDATTRANPGMRSVELDIQDPANIAAVAKKLNAEYPALNVLINNAGIMLIDDAAGKVDDQRLTSTVTTNLLGPIRLTSGLIEHLKQQPKATIIYTTSALGFVPLALTAVYSATKAALHSYVLSQRYKLKGTSVSVLEIAPPWVQTDLLNSREEPLAMPLIEFIEETIKALGTDADEILVERAKPFRSNPGPNESALVTQFNDMMIAARPQGLFEDQLVFGGRSIEGSLTGTAIDNQDTLSFSVLENVRPMVETAPLEQAADAYARMMRGEARFRMVLTMGQ